MKVKVIEAIVRFFCFQTGSMREEIKFNCLCEENLQSKF